MEEQQPPPEKTRKRRKKEEPADREWQKYVKSQSDMASSPPLTSAGVTDGGGGANRPIAKRARKKERKQGGDASSATSSGAAAEMQIDSEGLLFVEDDALVKSKEPSDAMRIEYSGERDALQLEQRAHAVHLLPAREKQSVKTLALTESHAHYNDITMDIRRMHWARNAEVRAHPMQQLLTRFMPYDNSNPEATLTCITRDLQIESQFMTHMRQQDALKLGGDASRNQDGSSNSLWLDEEPAKHDISSNKLNSVHGGRMHSINYNRRTPKDVEARMREAALSERLAKFREFYADDLLDPNVEFGAVPNDIPMFAQLKAQYWKKYQARDAVVQDCAQLVGKTDIEEVPRSHIRKYRKKPEPAPAGAKLTELCANGRQCIFFTASCDKETQYVGRVFYTPREEKGEVPLRNGERLCIDCLLHLWTTTYDRNIANEVICDAPINHFQVYCKWGEYSPTHMLELEANGRETGFYGHVPRFSINNRKMMVMVRVFQERGGVEHKLYTPYLDEVGMDF